VTKQDFAPRGEFTSTDLSARETDEKREEITNSVENKRFPGNGLCF
jgi:hypothetical protein